MEQITLFIDGKEIKAKKGQTILQAALENDIEIPYFCYHERLSLLGACRMCMVYLENQKRLVMSCITPVEEGLKVSLEHPIVKNNQKYILQALMTRHPLDCPICDKAGECDLQNYGAIYGPKTQIVPVSALEKEREEHDWQSDFLEYYSNRCVVCYRCTRACDEIVKAKALYVEERGFESNIVPSVRPIDTSTCEMCGLCVYVCPVGAIISKPFKYWSRSWLLTRKDTICNMCSIGCNIILEFGKGDYKSKEKVYRTKPKDSLDICAKGFFGYDILNENRLFEPISKENLPLNDTHIIFTHAISKKPALVVLSGIMTNEEIKEAISFSEKIGAYVTAPITVDLVPLIKGYETVRPYEFKTLKALENKTKFILIGDDISSLAPVLTYYIKGEVYKIGKSKRDEKLEPKEISLGDIKNILDEKTIAIVNSYSFRYEEAFELGKSLATLGIELLIVPKEFNSIGLYELTKNIPLTDLGLSFEMVENKDIKSLILVGEEIKDYFDINYLKNLVKNTHSIILTPFDDGLAKECKSAIPIPLFGENKGSATTLFGKLSFDQSLDIRKPYKNIWQDLKKNQPWNEELKFKEGVKKLNYKRDIDIYMSSWLTERSKNLSKLYEKNKNRVYDRAIT